MRRGVRSKWIAGRMLAERGSARRDDPSQSLALSCRRRLDMQVRASVWFDAPAAAADVRCVRGRRFGEGAEA